MFPIAKVKHYCTVNPETGETSKPRKSPRYGSVYDAFDELYKIKMFLECDNLYFHFVLLEVTEYRKTVKKSYRNHKGFEIFERIPTAITEEIYVDGKNDFGKFVPNTLPTPFTSAHFAKAIKRHRHVAQGVLNILLHVGAVRRVGKDKNSYLYEKI